MCPTCRIEPQRPEPIAQRRLREAAPDRAGCSVPSTHLHATVLIPKFGCGEPEQPVASERAAHGPRDLLPIEWRLRVLVVDRCRQRLPGTVTSVERRRATQDVAARTGHDVDGCRRRTPEFRAETARRDLEFLHGIDGQVEQRPAHHVVVVVLPVDGHVAAAAHLPGRRDQDAVRLGGIERRGRGVTWHQERQLQEVAAVERQRLDGGGSQDPVHRGTGRASHCHDADGFTDRRNSQSHVEPHSLADLQHDVGRLPGREAGQLDLCPVGPGRQQWQRKPPVGRRGRRPQAAGGVRMDRDGGPGHGSALRVHDLPGQRRDGGLRARQRGEDERKERGKEGREGTRAKSHGRFRCG